VYDPEMQKKSDELNAKAASYSTEIEQQFAAALLGLNECFVGQLLAQRGEIDQSFRSAIELLEKARDSVSKDGGSPTQVTGSDGKQIDLVAQIEQMKSEYASAMKAIDGQIKELSGQTTTNSQEMVTNIFAIT